MVFIQADAGFKYLTIKGDWELLSINDIDNEFHAVNHENNLVKHEYELIKNEYTRIINSRTWCWANNLADVLRFFRFNRILK